jgi:alkyldihydroxyacetonephosphate synthase
MKTTDFQFNMLLGELRNIVGDDFVITSDADRTIYGVDYFWIPCMYIDRGKLPPVPDVVVIPGSVEEVASIVCTARNYKVPITPWGGGSGAQGGIMPVYGGIMLDMKRLNRIVEINEISGTVTAQAGINGFDLELALDKAGWTLPHYPASVHSATLGGYLAHRGSGTISTKYGKAEDMVLSVQLVLPNGDIIRTLPVPNHAVGPGILQFLVGSEGCFGIITEATMRIERQPQVRRFHSFIFPDLHAGLEAGRLIMLERLQPLVIRLYDERSTLKTVKGVLGINTDKGVYMVIGFDGWEDIVAAQENHAFAICKKLGGQDFGEEAGRKWWEHRYDFYFPPEMLDLPFMFGTLDTVCTYDKLEPLYWAKMHSLEEKFKEWNIYYFAHFSHWYPWGAMAYDRFIIENPPNDVENAIKLHNEVWDTAIKINLEYGGVINEHHGIGLNLSRHIRKQYGPAFQIIENLKNSLDPFNIMNPGKLGFGSTK